MEDPTEVLPDIRAGLDKHIHGNMLIETPMRTLAEARDAASILSIWLRTKRSEGLSWNTAERTICEKSNGFSIMLNPES